MEQIVADMTAAPPPGACAHDARMVAALQAVRLAEQLLQIERDDTSVRLFDLPRRERDRYVDAAAVALALLDVDAQRPALYVAAHRLVDLGAQTPTQRRGLVQMMGQGIARYLEVLAGHHARTVAQLAPLVARDLATPDDDQPEGGI